MAGAIATLLLHNSGIVLATDDLEPNAADMSQLGEALMDTDQTLSKHIRQTFGEASPIRQSYFGTETYNLCTYRLDKARVTAVVFGPAVKEGQVWYYIREMVPALREALETDSEKPVDRQRQQKRDVFEMLDQFFPDRHETEAVLVTAQTIAVPIPPEAEDSSDTAAPTADLSALDEIDWDVPVNTDWETLSADADQSLEGITYEEAQQQGLIAPDLIEGHEQTEPGDSKETVTPPVDLPPVDEIDWQVPADMDWETFIADTDQGLEGIDFEEARKRGLVDGLDSQSVQTP